jgi:ATP-dependent Clp protease protease subunit
VGGVFVFFFPSDHAPPTHQLSTHTHTHTHAHRRPIKTTTTLTHTHTTTTTTQQDIKLFINSPGGSVTAGLGIYDGMQMARAPVATYCFGLAASMGAFLLCAGAKGKRHAMPNARIMIHQPLGGASGQAVDIEIQAKEIMFHKANLNRIMAAATGKGVDAIDADTDRDRYMSALEAKRYGLIDHVIGGDDAGFKLEGDLRRLPKTKKEYVAWGADGDDGSRSSRFTKPLEPFVKPFKED